MPISKIIDTGVTGLNIDSSGRILTPARPAFKAVVGTSQTVSTSSFTKMNWGSVSFDVGSNFSVTNNEFTAPVDGIYQFSVLVRFTANGGHNLEIVRLSIVGTSTYDVDLIQRQSTTSELDNSHVGGSTLLKLYANDTVAVECKGSGTSPTIGSSNGQYNWFCGYLVG